MGDIPRPGEFPRARGTASPFQTGPTSSGQPAQHQQNFPGSFQTAGYSSVPQQSYANPQHAFPSQLDTSQSQGSGRGAESFDSFNMNSLGNSLPGQQNQSGQHTQNQQRLSSGGASSTAMHAQIPTQYDAQGRPIYYDAQGRPFQYNAQGHIIPLVNQQYYPPAGQFYSQPSQQAQVSGRGNMTPFYPNPVLMNQQPSAPGTYYYPPGNPYGTHGHGLPAQQFMPTQYTQHMAPPPAQADPRMSASQPAQYAASSYYQPHKPTSTENRPKPSMVRGPPRKPKQTGHAVWIGNLPPQMDLMTLVHHVCSVAPGLDSLFYIAKSNCAFANFKDEESCVHGQQKVNDSRLGGGRLLARLRTSRVEGAGGIIAPTGPSGTPAPQTPASDASSESKEGEASLATVENADAGPLASTRDGRDISTAPAVRSAKDRYFILKSLTIEDVELSMQTNIWATQAHNEEALNTAFATADNVFLFFSANKSGSYAGYARMASAINDDPEALVLMSHGARGGDLPRAIPMEATGATPRGYIIDDSARGTIFWEADHDEIPDARRNSHSSLEIEGRPTDGGEEGGNASADAGSVRSEGSKPDLNTWGKPFKLEWISTNPLPFHRTRGMRNPWNNNRDIKVARDGTEVETMLGRKLAALFHRSTPSPAPNVAGGPPPPMAPMMQGGYNPHHRQYQQ